VEPDTEWEEVEYANHAVRPWCTDDHCFYCGKQASHKIEETSGPIHFHPLAADVCCEHFFGDCSKYPYEDMS
jgi:hypothetical protein